MTEQRCLMVLHAHPDDEVFRTAGIFAKYAAEGIRVVAVYATRGEQGDMHDPDLDEVEAKARLGEIREAEVRKALDILGVHEAYFLGYQDSGMKETEANANPEAFINAPIEESAQRLVEIMHATHPQILVSYDENGDGGYGHPDHIMCNRVAVEAFRRASEEPWGPRKLYYGASSRQSFKGWMSGLKELGLKVPWVNDDFNVENYGLPDEDITAKIDISRYVRLKKPALAAHRSQIPGDFFYLSIPDEALEAFAGYEHFVRVQPPARPGEHESDLFEGIAGETVAA